MQSDSEESWIRPLLDVGRALMSELDLESVLDSVLQTARELTGARYAALGILNEQRSELAQFLTVGIAEETRRAIGEEPRGRGVLGALIENPQPLRLTDVGHHPSSYGFPVGHPVMRNFLGVPILIRGEAWGNLYLTEKQHGDFTERDEEAATILADWAAIAIANARTYETSERRRHELEKAFRGLEATRDIAVAIGGEIELAHVLELIVKRGRALVGARSLVIMLREGAELVVQASAGHAREMDGMRLQIADSTSGQVLERRRAERITDVAARLRISPEEFGVPDAQSALMVPMVYRGQALGVLAAFDRREGASAFSEEDEQMLRTFAASAATAVALAQSVQSDRLRSSLAAADAERRRWARELHDETLQGLGGLRLLLASALRLGDLEPAKDAMREAVEHIEREIANLRAIITELRPAALDELGLHTALEALFDRHSAQSGFAVDAQLGPAPAGEQRLDEDIETTVYRLVQEALTNVAKHARADRVRVSVHEAGGEMIIEVADDGAGFDTSAASQGFGLAGMRERVALAGGTLEVKSSKDGTHITGRVPTRRQPTRSSARAVAS
jgi:signal transduction histidine kinase